MILPKVIFVHAPRCSGTSIEHSLMNGDRVPDPVKHYNATQIRATVGEEEWLSSFKFGIVRNPFDRVASPYITEDRSIIRDVGNMHSGLSMKQFIERYKPQPWEYGTQCSDYMNEDLDLIIKYEARSVGIAIANRELEKYGLLIDESVVKRNHKNKKKDFMSYFDDESEALVRARFSDDFERWYK